jgi:hypothetical protein
VNRADRSAATIRTASRISCRIAKRYASVNDSLPDAIMANDRLGQFKDLTSVGRRWAEFPEAQSHADCGDPSNIGWSDVGGVFAQDGIILRRVRDNGRPTTVS